MQTAALNAPAATTAHALAGWLRHLAHPEIARQAIDSFLSGTADVRDPEIRTALALPLKLTSPRVETENTARALAQAGAALEAHARQADYRTARRPEGMSSAEWDATLLEMADLFYTAAGLSLVDRREAAIALAPVAEFIETHLPHICD